MTTTETKNGDQTPKRESGEGKPSTTPRTGWTPEELELLSRETGWKGVAADWGPMGGGWRSKD